MFGSRKAGSLTLICMLALPAVQPQNWTPIKICIKMIGNTTDGQPFPNHPPRGFGVNTMTGSNVKLASSNWPRKNQLAIKSL